MKRYIMRRKGPLSSPSNVISSAAMLVLLTQRPFLKGAPDAVAHAYVTSGLPAHTHRAWLRKLTEDICETDPGSLSPEELHNAPLLMSAWVTAPEKNGRECAIAAEGLLKRVIDERRAGNAQAVAKTDDYNAVMKSWAKSGEKSAAALRIEQILMKMQDMYAAGDMNVQPNSDSFTIAVEAWTKSTDEKTSLRRAQQIIEWMVTLYMSSANDLAAPNTAMFYPILRSWARSQRLEAPIMAEQLIMWMQQLRDEGIETTMPDTMCFNTVLLSWLKSGDITSEKRIRQIFEYMELCNRRGITEVKPNSLTYNIVISSIGAAVKHAGDCGGARRADKILARLEKGFLAGDESLRPDNVIYNQVIDYWAKTQSIHGHFLRARDVLDRQLAMYDSGVRKCQPDVMSFTSVIAACASTYGSKRERRRAFDLAHNTFVESCKTERTRPNDVTYGLMFKAVSRLLHSQDERDRYSRTLFALCCDDGYLGEMAYYRLKDAVSQSLLSELTDGATYENLPVDWKRNLKSPHKYPTEEKNNNPSSKLRP